MFLRKQVFSPLSLQLWVASLLKEVDLQSHIMTVPESLSYESKQAKRSPYLFFEHQGYVIHFRKKNCPKNKAKFKMLALLVLGCTPIVPANREAKAGGS